MQNGVDLSSPCSFRSESHVPGFRAEHARKKQLLHAEAECKTDGGQGLTPSEDSSLPELLARLSLRTFSLGWATSLVQIGGALWTTPRTAPLAFRFEVSWVRRRGPAS